MNYERARAQDYRNFNSGEVRRVREVPSVSALGWLEGKRKWLALLASGLAFGALELMEERVSEQHPTTDEPAELVVTETDEMTTESRKRTFALQMAELAKIDTALKLAQQEASPEPPKEPDAYEDFLRLVYEDEDFSDFQFEKGPDGTYMIAPKDDVLEFSGVEVRREEDGTFTLGTASGLDSAINVDSNDMKQILLAKMELSKLYRERITSENAEGSKAVAEAIVKVAREKNLPLNTALVQEKIDTETSS